MDRRAFIGRMAVLAGAAAVGPRLLRSSSADAADPPTASSASEITLAAIDLNRLAPLTITIRTPSSRSPLSEKVARTDAATDQDRAANPISDRGRE